MQTAHGRLHEGFLIIFSCGLLIAEIMIIGTYKTQKRVLNRLEFQQQKTIQTKPLKRKLFKVQTQYEIIHFHNLVEKLVCVQFCFQALYSS